MLKMGDEVVFPENGPYHICRHNLLALVHVQIGCIRLDSGEQRIAVHVNVVKDNADAVWVSRGVVYEHRVVQQFRYLACKPFRQPMCMMVALEATFALHGVPKVLLRVEKGQLLEPHLCLQGRPRRFPVSRRRGLPSTGRFRIPSWEHLLSRQSSFVPLTSVALEPS